LAVAEVSLIRVRRSQVLLEVERGHARAPGLLRLVDELPLVFNTVLLLALLCQVTASTVSGFLAARWFGGMGVSLVTVIITATLFVYAEAIPKTKAMKAPHRTALALAPLLGLLVVVMKPLVAVLVRLAHFHSGAAPSALGPLTEGEIRVLAKESAEAGQIAVDDADLVDRSFEFNDRRVADIMVPRSEVVAVASDDDVEDAVQSAVSAGHRRLPVYQDTLDVIIGVVRLRDLAAARSDTTTSVGRLASEVVRCRVDEPISELLRRMQLAGRWLAIVTDEEDQTTVGLVTIEDIVSELVGEIADDQISGSRQAPGRLR